MESEHGPEPGLISADELTERLGITGRKATYVSTPITTGHIFLRRIAQTKNPSPAEVEAYTRMVIDHNVAAAADLISHAKKRYSLVVDPTGLDVPGWRQLDYHRFWIRIIRNHAERVIFADGWCYSNGCAIEFAAAYSAGLELLDHNFRPLDPLVAREHIGGAVAAYEAAGANSATLRKVLAITAAADDGEMGIQH